jgi:hypothetical protein
MLEGPLTAAERRRLLARLRTDVGQTAAEIAHVRAQARVLLDAETFRPLTPDEAKQQRALSRKAHELHVRLRQLRRELDQVQQGRVA